MRRLLGSRVRPPEASCGRVRVCPHRPASCPLPTPAQPQASFNLPARSSSGGGWMPSAPRAPAAAVGWAASRVHLSGELPPPQGGLLPVLGRVRALHRAAAAMARRLASCAAQRPCHPGQHAVCLARKTACCMRSFEGSEPAAAAWWPALDTGPRLPAGGTSASGCGGRRGHRRAAAGCGKQDASAGAAGCRRHASARQRRAEAAQVLMSCGRTCRPPPSGTACLEALAGSRGYSPAPAGSPRSRANSGPRCLWGEAQGPGCCRLGAGRHPLLASVRCPAGPALLGPLCLWPARLPGTAVWEQRGAAASEQPRPPGV